MIRRTLSPLSPPHASTATARISVAGALWWTLLLWVLTLMVPAAVHAQLDKGSSPMLVEAGGSVLAQYVSTAVNSRNGLPENSVRSIAQSPDGYMWLATEEGLVRYDGSRTRVFDRGTDPILRDNFIQSVAAARDGSVWVSTRSGVSRYAHGSFVSHASNAGLTLRLVFSDASGNVWVGTDTGLYSVSNDGLDLVPFSGLANVAIRQMADGGDGSVWLATSTGLWHLEHGHVHRHGVTEGLNESDVKALTVDQEGAIWLATPQELIHWNHRVLKRLPVKSLAPDARISALLVDSAKNVWIGLESDGLAILQDNRIAHYRAKDGLPVDSIKALHKDRDGNLWIGLNGGGAVRFHAGLFTTYGQREGLTESPVWLARTARDGSVWTASHQGLDHLTPDGHVDHLRPAVGMTSGLVYSMFEDTDGSVWFGTDTGRLTHVQGSHLTVYQNPEHAQDQVRAILRGPDGSLFLLYHSKFGLVRFEDGKFIVEPRNIPGMPTTAARGPDGALWIGTDSGGVTKWNNGVVALYGPRQGFTAEFVKSLAVDRDGTAWVGTSPEGLSRIRGDHVTRFLPENGLFDYTVGTVTDDLHGYLWMTNNKGIFKVAKRELDDVAEGRANRIHSIVYGLPDGMRSAECNYDVTPSASLAPDGHLWFATTEGLVSVLPSASTIRSSNPKAVIEGAVVENVHYGGAPKLETTVGAHDVEFDFTAPDFAAPERLRFRYKLDGFDRDWSEVGHRQQAFYTRLPPGRYTLLVQAADGSGWPKESASMAVVLPPHFWQTFWFRSFAVLVMLLCGWGGYEVRVVALRRSQRILQEQVVARTAELQEAMREAEAAQHELQELATRDGMTRLWNRRQILKMLSNEANRAEREGLSLCVLMLDVDHFKQVNDTRGHLAGDRVLQAVASVLIDQTRPYDRAGRYGGEEFLVILCNCTLENGVKRADMIRKAIAQASVQWNGVAVSVTASFGVGQHMPGKTIEAMLDEADRALYHAKQTGRNRVCSTPLREATKDTQEKTPPAFVAEDAEVQTALVPSDRSAERHTSTRPPRLRTA